MAKTGPTMGKATGQRSIRFGQLSMCCEFCEPATGDATGNPKPVPGWVLNRKSGADKHCPSPFGLHLGKSTIIVFHLAFLGKLRAFLITEAWLGLLKKAAKGFETCFFMGQPPK